MKSFMAALAAIALATTAHAAPKRGPLGSILGVPFGASPDQAQRILGKGMRDTSDVHAESYGFGVRKFTVNAKLYGETIPLVLDFEGDRGLFSGVGHLDLSRGGRAELDDCYRRARAIVARMETLYGPSDRAPEDPAKELTHGAYALLGDFMFADDRYIFAEVRGCDFEVSMDHVVYYAPPEKRS